MIEDIYSRNCVTVNLSVLTANYRRMKSRVPEATRLLGMVKADAYGHGMIEAAKAFQIAGCDIFGVAELGEAIRLRKHGIEGEILVFLGCRRSELSLLAKYDLQPVVFDRQDIQELERIGKNSRKKIKIHLKVDTGMGRLGITPEEAGEYLDLIKSMHHVELAGVASHFPKGDEKDSKETLQAIKKFEELKRKYTWISDKLHIANSGGILNFPQAHNSLSRAGIALYGYAPDGKVTAETEDLQPAMEVATELIQVKKVKKGQGISYGHTYVAENDMRIGVIPMGYEDGLSRTMSNKGEVLVLGKRAKICGRICMNICMIDLSEIEDAVVGDKVVVLGCQGDQCITGDEIAARCHTISYEILCMFGNNNERKYIE